MAELINTEIGKAYLIGPEKRFYQIGRHPSNDLKIYNDDAVSRFHATIFKLNDDYYLLDHSLNGTHYNAEEPCFDKGTRLESVLETSKFQESVAGLKKQIKEKKVPKIPGFKPHAFENDRDIAYLLIMIHVPEEAALLASCGVQLADNSFIKINGNYTYQFKSLPNYLSYL